MQTDTRKLDQRAGANVMMQTALVTGTNHLRTDMPFAERSARVAKEWAQADKKQWQDMAAQEKLRIVNSK